MFSTIENAITNNGKSLVTWLLGTKFKEKLSEEIRHAYSNKILEYQTKTVFRFSKTQTLLHKDLVPFLDIYEPLTIVNNKAFVVSEGIAKKLFTLFPMISLWGNAGNGKTTIVKYLFIESVLSNFKIPILLNLRDIQVPSKQLSSDLSENIVYKHLLSHLKFYEVSEYQSITKRMLDDGMFLILLDGYDETDFEKSVVLNTHIQEFTNLFYNCVYFITSRFDSKATSLLSFKPFKIAPLTSKEIKSFIKRQFLDNNQRVEEIILTVFKDENKRYLEYLENPLFLILFLNSFDFYPNIPENKSRFFENVYNALYEKHDSFSKLGFNRKRYIKMPKEHFEKVLFSFCFISYFSRKFTFENNDINEILNRVKEQFDYTFKNDDYVKELKISLNLFVDENHHLKFIHLSMQEFFAAKFFTFLKDEEKRHLLETLAESENKNGGNQFFLEVIAELYPHDFYDYYLPAHVHFYCQTNKWAFEKGFFDSELYQTMMTRYPFTKRLFEKSENGCRVYLEFLKKYEGSRDLSFYMEFKNTENESNAVEIVTLFQFRENLLQMLNDYSQQKNNATKNILDIVFDKTAKPTYRPFGGIRLPQDT